MLKTETNTPEMMRRVLTAAKIALRQRKGLQADFEHGQWWVTCVLTGAQWSVCDSEPGPFCFEQVTRGEE